ncbi:MAG TPA: YbjN domain-containing protein [Acidimicrobiales bacterium]|nr:YbjN domain-containing protein [Acidimicrobiales bacterium]
MAEPLTPEELDALEARLDAWFAREAEENPMVAALDRGEPGERRWYLRVRGIEKETFTLWFTLGQRTLRYETYVMPAPEENESAFYEHLLVRNLGLYGWSFAIGEEHAVFLQGAIGAGALADDAVLADELDRITGSGWEYVERFFKPALRIGFATRFGGG